MDNGTSTSLWLTQKFPCSRSCPGLPGLLRSLWNLHQCLKIPNRICHYPKRQATCILFKETYGSSNKIHHHRSWTACDSGNTLWVQVYFPWTSDYNLHQSQESYLFELHYWLHHLLAIDCWGIWSPNIVYLPSKCNIIANAPSCLPKLHEPHNESFCSHHILQNQKSLQHFKSLQSLT